MISLATDIKMSLRNLTRNVNRSLVACLTVAGGVVAFLLAGGFVNWIFHDMREATIHSQLGHIQIVRPGYFEKGIADPYSFLLPATPPALTQFEALPEVASVTPRLAFSGLASRNDVTIPFIGEGIDPIREIPISTRITIVDGQNLSGIDAQEAILGEGLARSLDAKPGDTIVLLATASSGSASATPATGRARRNGVGGHARLAAADSRRPLPAARRGHSAGVAGHRRRSRTPARRGDSRPGDARRTRSGARRHRAILVRSHTQGHRIREALRRLGVGSVELSQNSIFQTPDAEELERILVPIAEAGRPALLYGALSTELMGFDAGALAALAGDERRLMESMARFGAYRETWLRRGFGVMLRAWIDGEAVFDPVLSLDLMEMRRVIEPAAVRMAALRASDEDRRNLRSAYMAMARAVAGKGAM